MAVRVHWMPSPKFNSGHPAPYVALVHHRMVGTLMGTDLTFQRADGRKASTTFGIGTCSKHANDGVCIHQYVRIGDQHWGNGNWDPTGSWDNWYPTTSINSRTIATEHEDNGGAAPGHGKGIVTQAIQRRSIDLDRLLISGDIAAMKAAGIQFRSGTETRISSELRALRPGPRTILTHHDIAGRLKPYCWLPWEDDKVGFPRDVFIAALNPHTPVPVEDTMHAYAVPKVPSVCDVAKGARLFVDSSLTPNNDPTSGDKIIDPGPRTMPFLGYPGSGVRQVEYIDDHGVHSGMAYFTNKDAITNIRAVSNPGDTTPYSEAQMTAAKKGAAQTVAKAATDAAAKI